MLHCIVKLIFFSQTQQKSRHSKNDNSRIFSCAYPGDFCGAKKVFKIFIKYSFVRNNDLLQKIRL